MVKQAKMTEEQKEKERQDRGMCRVEFVDENTFNLVCEYYGEEGGKQEVKLRLDLRLYPGEDALSNPVGEARNDTNMEPYLPPPVGRISFSLNPFKMLSQLMGPGLWMKIKAGLCMACCIALCIASIPMVASNLQSQFIMWLFGFK